MKKISPLIVFFALIGIVVFVWGFVSTGSSQSVKKTASEEKAIKMVDLSTQPEWVQKLDVNIKKGKSANGLENLTLSVKGIPEDVESLKYVMSFETSNAGTQGHFSSVPIKISGEASFVKTVDLGTCSTKSCVRWNGVTKADVELDFLMISGDEATWTKTVNF